MKGPAKREWWRTKKKPVKVHNSEKCVEAKSEIRLAVFDELERVDVLDAFCGPDGVMYERVWCNANTYVGIDRDWKMTDRRRRFVGDNMVVVGAIDPKPYNVFDLDAFGSPWEAAILLSKRRPFTRGERGAVILTDGCSMRSALGMATKAQKYLLGMKRLAPKADGYDSIYRMMKAALLERWNLRLCRTLESKATAQQRGANGNLTMIYTTLIVEGR